MTPKEEAIEIFNSFENYCTLIENFGKPCLQSQKECALICIEKIKNVYVKLTPKDDPYYFLITLEHYEDVEKAIEELC